MPHDLTVAKSWFWRKIQGTAALCRKINSIRNAIKQKERLRRLDNLYLFTTLIEALDHCMHFGDRACDIYELYHLVQERGRSLQVRI